MKLWFIAALLLLVFGCTTTTPPVQHECPPVPDPVVVVEVHYVCWDNSNVTNASDCPMQPPVVLEHTEYLADFAFDSECVIDQNEIPTDDPLLLCEQQSYLVVNQSDACMYGGQAGIEMPEGLSCVDPETSYDLRFREICAERGYIMVPLNETNLYYQQLNMGNLGCVIMNESCVNPEARYPEE